MFKIEEMLDGESEEGFDEDEIDALEHLLAVAQEKVERVDHAVDIVAVHPRWKRWRSEAMI